jgi:hypothetical protein
LVVVVKKKEERSEWGWMDGWMDGWGEQYKYETSGTTTNKNSGASTANIAHQKSSTILYLNNHGLEGRCRYALQYF